jgi:hypothetical protein
VAHFSGCAHRAPENGSASQTWVPKRGLVRILGIDGGGYLGRSEVQLEPLQQRDVPRILPHRIPRRRGPHEHQPAGAPLVRLVIQSEPLTAPNP